MEADEVNDTRSFYYAALNRLIRRTYIADGPGVDQFLAFDQGINPLLEFDANTAADVSHRYLRGPQVDQLLTDEQVTSTGSAWNSLDLNPVRRLSHSHDYFQQPHENVRLQQLW